MDIALLRQEIEQDPTGIRYPADVDGRLAAINAPRTKRWLILAVLDNWLKEQVNADGTPLWIVLDAVRQGTTPLAPVARMLFDLLDKASRTASSYTSPDRDAAYQWLSVESPATVGALGALVQAGVLTTAQAAEVVAMGRPMFSRSEVLWGETVTVDQMRQV